VHIGAFVEKPPDPHSPLIGPEYVSSVKIIDHLSARGVVQAVLLGSSLRWVNKSTDRPSVANWAAGIAAVIPATVSSSDRLFRSGC